VRDDCCPVGLQILHGLPVHVAHRHLHDLHPVGHADAPVHLLAQLLGLRAGVAELAQRVGVELHLGVLRSGVLAGCNHLLRKLLHVLVPALGHTFVLHH